MIKQKRIILESIKFTNEEVIPSLSLAGSGYDESVRLVAYEDEREYFYKNFGKEWCDENMSFYKKRENGI